MIAQINFRQMQDQVKTGSGGVKITMFNKKKLELTEGF